MSASTQEMARVVKSVKSDEVAVKNSLEEISPNRQDSVYFATRERRMQEEANSDIFLALSP